MRLEHIVEERTSQIRNQKDEIEEKSKKLEIALDDLSKAQYQLIRQEKMATVVRDQRACRPYSEPDELCEQFLAHEHRAGKRYQGYLTMTRRI